MPTKERHHRELVEAFRVDAANQNLAKRTIREVVRLSKDAKKHLDSAGKPYNPRKIGVSEANYVINVCWTTNKKTGEPLSAKTRKYNVAMWNIWLEAHGNYVVKKLKLRWPPETRTNVDWLPTETGQQIANHCETPLECLMVQLEINQGLRRCEVMRSKVDHIFGSTIRVEGKGRMGGKVRFLPQHSQTYPIYLEAIRYREALRQEALDLYGEVEDEGWLMCYRRGKVIRQYKESWMHDAIVNIRERMGVHFSHHTLRRTYGRTLWKAGVELETIKELLGHESVDQTIKYLGIKFDDMQSGMDKYEVYTGTKDIAHATEKGHRTDMLAPE